MAKKIKIRVQTEDKHINLPKIRFKTLIRLVRFGMWATRFNNAVDPETRADIKANRKEIIRILKIAAKELKSVPPFTLVEVNSKDANVLIDIL